MKKPVSSTSHFVAAYRKPYGVRFILWESIKSGTLAALAMVPFGLAFRVTGFRVGHYGPKFAGLFVQDPTPAILFVQHILLGWVSAIPLVALICWWRTSWSPLVVGSFYGALYYVLVNSLALPLYFGDSLPWQIGLSTIIPSLVIHIVFGLTVGFFSRRLAPFSASA